MSANVGPPQIGQWYARGEKGEVFRVVGRDARSRAVEIQTFDGELDEIDAAVWGTLPLERVEAPEPEEDRDALGARTPALPGDTRSP